MVMCCVGLRDLHVVRGECGLWDMRCTWYLVILNVILFGVVCGRLLDQEGVLNDDLASFH